MSSALLLTFVLGFFNSTVKGYEAMAMYFNMKMLQAGKPKLLE